MPLNIQKILSKINISYYDFNSYKIRFLWLASILITIGSLYGLLLRDDLSAYEKSKDLYAQQLTQFKIKYQQYVNLQIMQQQLLRTQSALLSPEKIIPYLVQILTKLPIHLIAIEPMPSSKPQQYTSLLKLTFQGNERQIMRFISRLPSLPILTVVTELSISNKNNPPILILSITLEVYHR